MLYIVYIKFFFKNKINTACGICLRGNYPKLISLKGGQAEIIMGINNFTQEDLFALDGTYGNFSSIKEEDLNDLLADNFRLIYESRHDTNYYVDKENKRLIRISDFWGRIKNSFWTIDNATPQAEGKKIGIINFDDLYTKAACFASEDPKSFWQGDVFGHRIGPVTILRDVMRQRLPDTWDIRDMVNPGGLAGLMCSDQENRFRIDFYLDAKDMPEIIFPENLSLEEKVKQFNNHIVDLMKCSIELSFDFRQELQI